MARPKTRVRMRDPLKYPEQKKALEKGEYLQGNNAISLL